MTKRPRGRPRKNQEPELVKCETCGKDFSVEESSLDIDGNYICPTCTAGDEEDAEERGRRVKTRQQIIEQARRIRAEIEQVFADTAHWNRINPNQEPLDADPDGTLARLAMGIDRMLATEGKP